MALAVGGMVMDTFPSLRGDQSGGVFDGIDCIRILLLRAVPVLVCEGLERRLPDVPQNYEGGPPRKEHTRGRRYREPS